MIVRRLQDAEKSGRHIVSNGWESTRLLHKNDGMGFPFQIATIYKGAYELEAEEIRDES